MSPVADPGSEAAGDTPRAAEPTPSGADRLAGFAASLAADAGRAADSAGQPWAGREFDDNPFGGDDGAAPPELLEALAGFRGGRSGPEDVVDALRGARLLVPLIAELGEEGTTTDGHLVDKSQELSLVTVAGPDGRTVQPVFSSVAAMQRWNPAARPVPVEARRVALAAVSEGVELLVLDPTSETEFVVRRPAVWAVAQGSPWLPPQSDPVVVGAFRASIDPELGVQAVELASGDPEQRLVAEELVVRLSLSRGLSEEALGAILSRLAQRWAADDAIATRVDSLRVQLAAAPD